MRILVLAGSDSASVRHLHAMVERHAAALGLTPLFAQCADPDIVAQIAATTGYRILPLDDVALGPAARLSDRMACPILHGDPALIADKFGQRRALARHGLPTPPFALVETEQQARECGRRWGYPLVLKPVCGTESRGVRRVDDPAGVADALADAHAAARDSGRPGVLAEGYLDGPDVAVESMVLDGVTHHVSFGQSGWYGRCWQAAAPVGPALQPHLEAIGAAVAQANAALGLRWAATSNELRLTAAGPVIVEVNARLGGGGCEDAILLHAGVDRVRAMLELLRGERPDIAPRYHRPVAQTAFRPAEPGVVRSVEIPAELLADAAVRLELAVAPGMRIVDPRASFAGWLLLQGRPGEQAGDLLSRAAAYAGQIRIMTTQVS